MALLGDDDAQYLRDAFSVLSTDVTLTVVSRLVLPGSDGDPSGPDVSAQVKQIVGEVAAISPRLKVEHIDAAADADRAEKLAGTRMPAIVFGAASARGQLRYYGLPAGYEMSTLVATVMDLGSGEPMVPPQVADALAKLESAVHIEVFVTPG
jgi:alkyl hydroperoxide reductase subunit AhpF